MPFTAFFPAGVANPGLIDLLTSQRSLQGLLRGAVGGLQQVMRRGRFTIPASVERATEHFRNEADPMRAFMTDKVRYHHADDPVFLPRTDLYGAYVAWAALNGFSPMAASRFYESFIASAVDVSEFPVIATVRGGTRGYKGITIR